MPFSRLGVSRAVQDKIDDLRPRDIITFSFDELIETCERLRLAYKLDYSEQRQEDGSSNQFYYLIVLTTEEPIFLKEGFPYQIFWREDITTSAGKVIYTPVLGDSEEIPRRLGLEPRQKPFPRMVRIPFPPWEQIYYKYPWSVNDKRNGYMHNVDAVLHFPNEEEVRAIHAFREKLAIVADRIKQLNND